MISINKFLKKFRKDEKGIVAILTAVAISVFIFILYLTIDLNRAQNYYAYNQSGVDSAALGTIDWIYRQKLANKDQPGFEDDKWKDFQPTNASMKQYARKQYMTTMTDQGYRGESYEFTKFETNYTHTPAKNSDTFTLEVDSCIEIDNKVAALPEKQEVCNVSSASLKMESVLADIEIAFSLDYTQSMNGTKITRLKEAVHTVVDEYMISTENAKDNDIFVSVTPFTSLVHIHPYDGDNNGNNILIKKQLYGSACQSNNKCVGDRMNAQPDATFFLTNDDFRDASFTGKTGSFRKFNPYWSWKRVTANDLVKNDTLCNKVVLEHKHRCDGNFVDRTPIFADKLYRNSKTTIFANASQATNYAQNLRKNNVKFDKYNDKKDGWTVKEYMGCHNPSTTNWSGGGAEKIVVGYNENIKMSCYTQIDQTDNNRAFEELNVQPLTYNADLIKDMVSRIEDHVKTVADIKNSQPGNQPPVQKELAPFQTSGATGLFTSWLTLAPGWQGKWDSMSLMEEVTRKRKMIEALYPQLMKIKNT